MHTLTRHDTRARALHNAPTHTHTHACTPARTHTHTHTNRQTDRQTDRQTEDRQSVCCLLLRSWSASSMEGTPHDAAITDSDPCRLCPAVPCAGVPPVPRRRRLQRQARCAVSAVRACVRARVLRSISSFFQHSRFCLCAALPAGYAGYTGVPAAAAADRLYVCATCSVSEGNYWSPAGLKTTFFKCRADALNRPQCLPGTPHQNSSQALVYECAPVRTAVTPLAAFCLFAFFFAVVCVCSFVFNTRTGGRACQNYQDVLCYRCNDGYYPLIGLCLECPEVGRRTHHTRRHAITRTHTLARTRTHAHGRTRACMRTHSPARTRRWSESQSGTSAR
jgi:hypothetical protein